MITVDHVSKTYRTDDAEQHVLDGVDLHIGPGEFVCVLGPSGCGKTTLLNLVAGFIHPDRGRILMGGSEVTGPAPDRGVVFQDPTLFPWLSVLANVRFGLESTGMHAEEATRTATRALLSVGLPDRHDSFPHSLSGGMKQRVALARVLALDPGALLLDEPLSALDAASRESLQDTVLGIWRERKLSVLFVTHHVDEAVYLADRVVLMGHCPVSTVLERTVDVPRPRRRGASELRDLAEELRAALAEQERAVVEGTSDE